MGFWAVNILKKAKELTHYKSPGSDNILTKNCVKDLDITMKLNGTFKTLFIKRKTSANRYQELSD